MTTRRTALATSLATLAIGGLGGVGIASGQPPDDPGRQGEPKRELHRQMIDHHRAMMRNPEMRGHMRNPEMRAMHRDMMRMMHMGEGMPEMGMMD